MIDEGMFAALDDGIRKAAPEDRPALLIQLAARIVKVTALGLPTLAADARAPQSRNLSAKEAAKRLGISEPMLYKHADEFPFTVRIGERVVFDSAGVEAWNKGQRPNLGGSLPEV